MMMKTHEQFALEVAQKFGDVFEFTKEYSGTKNSIIVKHKICGVSKELKPSNFISGIGCAFCYGYNKKTIQEYKQEVLEKRNGEYEILGSYINRHEKIKTLHVNCGKTWNISPSNLLNGRGCPYCYGNKIIKEQDFVQEISELGNDEYTLISKYKNRATKVLLNHKICGYSWSVTPNNFLRGQRCSECAKEKRRKSLSLGLKGLKERVYDVVGDEYTVLGETYINIEIPMLMRHNLCGHEWKTNPNHFLNSGTRCPRCADERLGDFRRKTQEKFEFEVKENCEGEYIVLGEYKGQMEKIEVQHKKCGTLFEVYPKLFLNSVVGNCPLCFTTKGETAIKNYLNKHYIEHEIQYRFKDCKAKYTLPFDFAVFEEGILKCLIEYDGEQHFRPIKYFGGARNFSKQQKYDSIKNTYCKNKGIPLLRIPYTKIKEIDTILDNFFEVNNILKDNQQLSMFI